MRDEVLCYAVLCFFCFFFLHSVLSVFCVSWPVFTWLTTNVVVVIIVCLCCRVMEDLNQNSIARFLLVV